MYSRLNEISTAELVFGCDPEFFFSKNGKILGAEKILESDGLEYVAGSSKKRDGDKTTKGTKNSRIIIDGVQAELNPRPNTCRANLANEISCCFATLFKEMEKKNVLVDFAPTVEVSAEEFESLSEKSKIFGCSPSKNFYDSGLNSIKVDPLKYRKRSAGGHIHLGQNSPRVKAVLDNPRIVPILDILVGNTCVLLDRDEGNIERRKVYGRAGEFRTPPHGIEYRTLSNFWLRHYVLMSLVFGLSRLAVIVAVNGKGTELRNLVNKKDIHDAINNNDYDLAYKNFSKIQEWLIESCPTREVFPLHKNNLHLFHHFIKKGMDYWFKEDPLTHWINLPEGHNGGFTEFLRDFVSKDLTKED